MLGCMSCTPTHPSPLNVSLANPAGDAAQACIRAYFAELQTRIEGGFDPGQSVSAHPEELVPPAGCFLLATRGGQAIGCGGLKVTAPGVGEIKRMWVAPTARGMGVAQRLLTALETQALALHLKVLQLDTHGSLTEARKLYARNGYVEIPAYNDNPYAHHWFEKRIYGSQQTA